MPPEIALVHRRGPGLFSFGIVCSPRLIISWPQAHAIRETFNSHSDAMTAAALFAMTRGNAVVAFSPGDLGK